MTNLDAHEMTMQTIDSHDLGIATGGVMWPTPQRGCVPPPYHVPPGPLPPIHPGQVPWWQSRQGWPQFANPGSSRWGSPWGGGGWRGFWR
jgi:hypothetical protein